MLVLAAATTTVGRFNQIPTEFWVRLGLGVLVLAGVVIVLRKVAKVNKVVLAVIVGLLVSTVGFNWVYERSEPPWATPVVNWLSGFLPTKGMYARK